MDAVMKSLFSSIELNLKKAELITKAAAVGTIHTYSDGKKYQKQSDGAWKPIKSETKSKESNSDKETIDNNNKINNIKNIVKNLSIPEIVNYDWDKVAFGFSNDNTISIPLNKLNVKYKADMENVNGQDMKKYFKNQPIDKIPPVDVSYQNGKFYIEDGHHRYGYAKQLGMKNIKVKIQDIKDNPITAMGFKSIDDIIKLKDNK